ncbi:DNA replication complex GINS protein PSF3 [Termitomyces sp. T112]|nr:DNA replication complex GINS protein PSF3 [Termitomyces sp. T112]
MQIAALSKIQIPIWLAYVLIYSDWADFNIPTAFGPRVRNALKAEARSVRLAGLVGAGGLWYGFGKTISDILAEEQANEFSEMLIKVGFFSLHLYSLLKRQTLKTFRARLIEVIDQAQHFAALGPVGTSGSSGDIAQMFREGLDAAERELSLDELRSVPSARACSSCFIPDPTSLRLVRSSIFYSMLSPRLNLTMFEKVGDDQEIHTFKSEPYALESESQHTASSTPVQTQPHFVWSLYFKLNAKSQTQPHFVQLGPCISNSMLSPRPNLTSFS